jgi:hypothetical protein
MGWRPLQPAVKCFNDDRLKSIPQRKVLAIRNPNLTFATLDQRINSGVDQIRWIDPRLRSWVSTKRL